MLDGDNELPGSTDKDKGIIGQDVYENAKKLNTQLATKGPAIMLVLEKVSKQVSTSHTVTGVCGMVIGGIGFWGNRYYKNKGDDTAYTYMGQIVGMIQFLGGLSLLAVEGFETYYSTGEEKSFMNVIKWAAFTLTMTESALVLLNSYLYGDSTPTKLNSAKIKPD